MITPKDIGQLFEQWMKSRDPIAVRAVALMSQAEGPLGNAIDLVAAGFSAGFVAGARCQCKSDIDSEASVLLEDYTGRKQ